MLHFKQGAGLFRLTLGDGISKTPGCVRASNTSKALREYQQVSIVCIDN